MMRLFPTFLIGIALLSGLFVTSSPTFAQGIKPIDPVSFDCNLKSDCTIEELIQLVTNVLFGLAGSIFIIMLLIGGIRYLSGAGNQQQTDAAKNTLSAAVIGLIVVIAGYAVIQFLVNQFTKGS